MKKSFKWFWIIILCIVIIFQQIQISTLSYNQEILKSQTEAIVQIINVMIDAMTAQQAAQKQNNLPQLKKKGKIDI